MFQVDSLFKGKLILLKDLTSGVYGQQLVSITLDGNQYTTEPIEYTYLPPVATTDVAPPTTNVALPMTGGVTSNADIKHSFRRLIF